MRHLRLMLSVAFVAAVLGLSAIPANAAAGDGYYLLDAEGHVWPFGGASHHGQPIDQYPDYYPNCLQEIVDQIGTCDYSRDLEPTPTGAGYWVIDTTGWFFAFGDAANYPYSSTNTCFPPETTPGAWIAVKTDDIGSGLWLFSDRGHVHTCGDARHLGDLSSMPLNGGIIAASVTPDGNGYWMLGSDGGIFAFGTAQFYGSLGGIALNAPTVGLSTNRNGDGYLLVASDGGIFAFGNTAFFGSLGGIPLNSPVVGMAPSPAADGYTLVGSDGGVFSFGPGAPFHGSLGGNPPVWPVLDVSPTKA